ncbi:MAG: terminase family protein [Alphaproteobacteria bacterium]|nr:terminase family protein [Alphaproteobacteria bacterium]
MRRNLASDLVRTLLVLQTRGARNKLETYIPYPKQREFHDAGAANRERLFMAGNQLGKTLAGGFECAMHLTGRYPNWWKGRKFDRAVRFWVASVTGESTRDNAQRILVGPPAVREAWGTGTIPADAIEQVSLSRNLANAVDSIVVRHRSGNLSMLKFKAYGMGREKWQGETLDGVWFDEEPPLDIYIEGLTRTNATKGFTMLTFTPLLGMSSVVRLFMSKAAG